MRDNVSRRPDEDRSEGGHVVGASHDPLIALASSQKPAHRRFHRTLISCVSGNFAC